jgi:hypothetical protein
MLSNEETIRLNNIFNELYKKKTPMELLEILAIINNYLHKESAIIRRLSFHDEHWKFRAEQKLRRDAVLSEIRKR